MSVEDEVLARLELIRVQQFKAQVVEPPPPHVPPKKYVLFAWHWYDATGGLTDMEGSYDTLLEAWEAVEKMKENDGDDSEAIRFQIVDRDTWHVVVTSH